MSADSAKSSFSHSETRRLERASSLTNSDMDKLWKICGLECEHSAEFAERVRQAVYFYFPGPDSLFLFPAKERARLYDKLEKTVGSLRDQLENIHEEMINEIDWSGEAYEPEGFDTSLPADFGAITYGGYLIYRLQDQLEDFAHMVSDAREDHGKSRGKPKQNESLESTIRDLGEIYQRFSGRAPMAGYRYDELDEQQPYKGPFFDFVHALLWTVNGSNYPTSNTIGDTARRLFKLRK